HRAGDGLLVELAVRAQGDDRRVRVLAVGVLERLLHRAQLSEVHMLTLFSRRSVTGLSYPGRSRLRLRDDHNGASSPPPAALTRPTSLTRSERARLIVEDPASVEGKGS